MSGLLDGLEPATPHQRYKSGKKALAESYQGPGITTADVNNFLADMSPGFRDIEAVRSGKEVDSNQSAWNLLSNLGGGPLLRHAVGSSAAATGPSMQTFGGRLAKTADHAALAKAEELAAKGTPREDIWKQTGWFQGADKKWRFEIDDSSMKPVRGTFSDAIERGGTRSLGIHLEHPGLFSAYPATERIPVTMRGGSGASYSRGEISTSSPQPKVLLHEVQHHIQDKEGLARGGSVAEFSNHANRKTPQGGRFAWTGDEPSAVEKYRQLAGEVEARAVEKRMRLTPDERRARAPWHDYDVPEAQQIVRFDVPGPQQSLAPRPTDPKQSIARKLAGGGLLP